MYLSKEYCFYTWIVGNWKHFGRYTNCGFYCRVLATGSTSQLILCSVYNRLNEQHVTRRCFFPGYSWNNFFSAKFWDTSICHIRFLSTIRTASLPLLLTERRHKSTAATVTSFWKRGSRKLTLSEDKFVYLRDNYLNSCQACGQIS